VSARDAAGGARERALTHVGADGDARMVDVSSKPATDRYARATGAIRMRAATLAAIRDDTLAKGDVLTVAKVAGIMAAKRTSELVPLCHPIALSDVQIVLSLDDTLPGVRVEATARTTAQTGVEMEAVTAVSLCLVTLYDMAKSVDREMVISDVMLVEKSGGRSGRWVR
jgi:cyclic pyranopterin phosphate synthase